MDMRRRSPLRILAPVALVVFGVALAMIISSANSSGGGGGTSASKAEKARDLGTSTTKATKKKRSSDKLPKSIYIVKSGDTFGSIAQKVGVSEAKLQELNPDIDPFSLAPGQKIKIR
jgi:teichoic acid transport system ATP-binding protein